MLRKVLFTLASPLVSETVKKLNYLDSIRFALKLYRDWTEHGLETVIGKGYYRLIARQSLAVCGHSQGNTLVKVKSRMRMKSVYSLTPVLWLSVLEKSDFREQFL